MELNSEWWNLVSSIGTGISRPLVNGDGTEVLYGRTRSVLMELGFQGLW